MRFCRRESDAAREQLAAELARARQAIARGEKQRRELAEPVVGYVFQRHLYIYMAEFVLEHPCVPSMCYRAFASKQTVALCVGSIIQTI